jgi:hypothetical protein
VTRGGVGQGAWRVAGGGEGADRVEGGGEPLVRGGSLDACTRIESRSRAGGGLGWAGVTGFLSSGTRRASTL